jgi:hypothetical protein
VVNASARIATLSGASGTAAQAFASRAKTWTSGAARGKWTPKSLDSASMTDAIAAYNLADSAQSRKETRKALFAQLSQEGNDDANADTSVTISESHVNNLGLVLANGATSLEIIAPGSTLYLSDYNIGNPTYNVYISTLDHEPFADITSILEASMRVLETENDEDSAISIQKFADNYLVYAQSAVNFNNLLVDGAPVTPITTADTTTVDSDYFSGAHHIIISEGSILTWIGYHLAVRLDNPNTSGGSGSGGGSGDPIMTPMFGHPFKLPVDSGNYLLFDNQDLDQRLIINVKCNILSEEERLKVQEYCDEVWGRPQHLLSYMKYISVFWEGEWTSYDMDTLSLCDVPSNSAIDNLKLKSKEALETTLSNRVISWYNEKHDTETATLRWETIKHGKVVLNLEKYADLEIRNGVRLHGQNITKHNSFGALVACAAAKNLRVKKPLSTPKIQNDYTHDLAFVHGAVEYNGQTIMRDMLMKARTGDRIRPGIK